MPPQAPDSLLHVEAAGDPVVVRLADEAFYEENVVPTGERLSRLADGLGPRALRLDLAAVGFLSSSGLVMLVGLHKLVAAAGGRLRLTQLSPRVYEVFEITKLTSRLDVHRAGAEDAEAA
jgi:anti-anti-sigma factor